MIFLFFNLIISSIIVEEQFLCNRDLIHSIIDTDD